MSLGCFFKLSPKASICNLVKLDVGFENDIRLAALIVKKRQPASSNSLLILILA